MRRTLLLLFIAVLTTFMMLSLNDGAAYAAVDTTGPTAELDSLGVTLPEGKTAATVGDTVTVSMSVADEAGGSGMGTCYICYVHPMTEKTTESYFIYNAETGKSIYTMQIDELTESGKWQIKYIKLYDKQRNATELYDKRYFPTSTDAVDLSAGDFTVAKTFNVSFDSRGGSTVDTQNVIEGQSAVKPEDPTKECAVPWGAGFMDWYSDEGLTEYYNFDSAVTGDLTLYAKWYYAFSISNYDITNNTDDTGGKYEVLWEGQEESEQYLGCMNMTLEEGTKLTLKAHPDKGYVFVGWYKGKYTGGSSGQSAEPLDTGDPDNLLSTETTYAYTCNDYMVICPVFEVCSNHDFGGEQIKKATPETDGFIYRVCNICGEEENVAPLLKVSNIRLDGTSFDYTGKTIEPKVTVANTNEELSADNYTLTYSNNVKPGTATVTVTLKGEYYEGSKELKFEIKDPMVPSTKPGSTGKTIKVSGITLTGISGKIAAGKKIKLTATVFPRNASDKKLKWATSNKKLATVSSSGVVKINKKAGGKTVKITAAAKDGSGKKAIWKIKIMKGAVKKITVKGAQKTIIVGKTMKLRTVIKTTKGKPVNKKLKWISLNPKYASVTQTGKVKALTAGKGKAVKIKVMSTDGTNKSVVKKIRIR